MNWVGKKYNANDPLKFDRSMIVKKLREEFKNEGLFPKKFWKFSISKADYSTIRIRIMRAPKSAFNLDRIKEREVDIKKLDDPFSLTFHDLWENVQEKLNEVGNYYNYDDSDVMTDYFDRCYYLTWEIGSYKKKPFIEIVEVN